jgi:transcriptional regulator with XRE-family HTH domain
MMKNRMRELREYRRLSQAKLAAVTGIHPATISRIEGGVIAPTLEQAEKLAAALGTRETFLFPGPPPTPRSNSGRVEVAHAV